jgi:hypothetical protein
LRVQPSFSLSSLFAVRWRRWISRGWSGSSTTTKAPEEGEDGFSKHLSRLFRHTAVYDDPYESLVFGYTHSARFSLAWSFPSPILVVSFPSPLFPPLASSPSYSTIRMILPSQTPCLAMPLSILPIAFRTSHVDALTEPQNRIVLKHAIETVWSTFHRHVGILRICLGMSVVADKD